MLYVEIGSYLTSFCVHREDKNKAEEDPIPPGFIKVVKCTLAKMTGAGYLRPSLINLNFCKKIPRKMSNMKAYLIKKKGIYFGPPNDNNSFN